MPQAGRSAVHTCSGLPLKAFGGACAVKFNTSPLGIVINCPRLAFGGDGWGFCCFWFTGRPVPKIWVVLGGVSWRWACRFRLDVSFFGFVAFWQVEVLLLSFDCSKSQQFFDRDGFSEFFPCDFAGISSFVFSFVEHSLLPDSAVNTAPWVIH